MSARAPFTAFLLAVIPMAAQQPSSSIDAAHQADSSPHSVQFVTVDNGVKLEVLDWGGGGKPLILLAGAGSTAHVFDSFAPKLTPK